MSTEKLLNCQCGGIAVNRGHGISCLNCGIWLGDGTDVVRLGGLINAWNNRNPSIKQIQAEALKVAVSICTKHLGGNPTYDQRVFDVRNSIEQRIKEL